MKVYTYSEARQNLSELLNQAQAEEVIIKGRDGAVFSVKAKKPKKSPLDVEGIESTVSKKQILAAVRESRKS
ncbi:type II toxin-antitoxin system prevent-host-death family antitoxin [Acaryochloris sp. CCMEE 5410]|nr:type II toxin-antitoxin system prevent-host-death family antitoxin [Acaryochloris sp. CCMEE 5410]